MEALNALITACGVDKPFSSVGYASVLAELSKLTYTDLDALWTTMLTISHKLITSKLADQGPLYAKALLDEVVAKHDNYNVLHEAACMRVTRLRQQSRDAGHSARARAIAEVAAPGGQKCAACNKSCDGTAAIAYPCKHENYCSDCANVVRWADRCAECGKDVQCWGRCGPMHVIVKTVEGKYMRFECATVNDLKLEIQTKEGVPPEQQRLFFRGKQMEDGHNLVRGGELGLLFRTL